MKSHSGSFHAHSIEWASTNSRGHICDNGPRSTSAICPSSDRPCSTSSEQRCVVGQQSSSAYHPSTDRSPNHSDEYPNADRQSTTSIPARLNLSEEEDDILWNERNDVEDAEGAESGEASGEPAEWEGVSPDAVMFKKMIKPELLSLL